MIPILTRGPDGPPGGHADLSRSFPRLKKNSLEGILAVKVFATSLRPEIVEQEALEDVEGLPAVGETAHMVTVEVQEIVIFFKDGLSKENKWPGDVEAVGRPPFVPNTEVGIPSLLSRGAFHEAVLGGFRESLVTALAEAGSHAQPGVKDTLPQGGLSSRGEAPNEELCEQSLRLSFRVDDPEASLGDREDQGLPFYFCSSIGSFSAPYKVPHYSAYLTTHPRIRVPGCCQCWGDLIDEFLKEFGRDAITSWRFALWHHGDGISDFFQGELFGQLLVRFVRDPNQGVGPARFHGFRGVGSAHFRGVEMRVEGSNIVSQVLLTHNLSLFGCQFFEECSFPPDAMEVKEPFRARVSLPEPRGRTELVVSHHLLLEGVCHVSLCRW
ncbi:unnamed protein product [Sphagnum tenellum]